MGLVTEHVYPSRSSMEFDEILKYLITIQTLTTSKNIQIRDEDKTVLIYGVPTRDQKEFNYDFLILSLNKQDLTEIERFQFILKSYGDRVLLSEETVRKKKFDELAHDLFETTTQKIVFVGFPNAGKTSTKRFFFQKIREDEIISSMLEPTIGYEVDSYNFLDLNLTLFDTSGQELEDWFTINSDVLKGTDLLIFFFSIDDWKHNKDLVKSYISRLKSLNNEEFSQQRILTFCHKIDLLEGNVIEFKNKVRNHLGNLEIPIFFTSITDGGNEDLTLGFQLLFVRFSTFIIDFNQMIVPIIERSNLKPIYLIDSNYSILLKYEIDEEVNIRKEDLIKYYPQFFYFKTHSHINEYPIISFSHKSKDIAYAFIDVSSFYPEISNIFVKTASLSNLDNFIKIYRGLLRSYEWETKK